MSDPKITYDFDARNLPKEYLQAIGLVVASSAQTESIVGDFIGTILGIDNVDTVAVTANMSIPLRDALARSLIEQKTERSDIVDQVDDLLDDIRTACDARNTIAHNSFVINPETGEVLSHRLKVRGSLQIELKPISVEEINQCAAAIYKSGIALADFMTRLNITPRFRTKPLMAPLKRNKKAREKRRNRSF